MRARLLAIAVNDKERCDGSVERMRGEADEHGEGAAEVERALHRGVVAVGTDSAQVDEVHPLEIGDVAREGVESLEIGDPPQSDV